MDSDAPMDRAMTVRIAVLPGVVDPERLEEQLRLHPDSRELTLTRDDQGMGTLSLPGSVGIVPRITGSTDTVTAWVRASLPARGTAPGVELDRVVRFPFVRGQRGTVRVYLPVRCADRAVDCTSVSDELCTVSIRCREQGATCGDLGECVQVDVPVRPPDAGTMFDAAPRTVDVATGRTVRDVLTDRPTDASMDVLDATMDVPSDIASDIASDVQIDGLSDVPSDAMPTAPIQLSPLNGFTVTNIRPTLSVRNLGGVTDAVFELCRDRACTMIEHTMMGGRSVRPPADLSAGSHWWRARTLVGGVPVGPYSLVWNFTVPPASTPADTFYRASMDLDDDGFADIAMGAPQADPGANPDPGRGYVQIRWGSAMGPVMGPTIFGDAVGDRFGFSLSAAGDVNCDGVADLLVGAPQSSTNATADGGVARTGYARVLLGTRNRASFGAPALTWTYRGSNPGSQFGYAVAGIGDLDGKGCADIAVGAPFDDPGSVIDAGTVQVYWGSGPGNVGPLFNGARANDRLGFALSGAGDFDGDRLSDMLIGAPGVDMGANADVGAVTVVFGRTLLPHPQVVFAGSTALSQFGASVALDGDLNGDGLSDVVAGSPGELAGNGRVYLFQGNAGRALAMPWRNIDGTTTERFGHSVALMGRAHASTFESVVVGGPYYTPPMMSTQGRYSFFAQPTAVMAAPWGNSGSNFGSRANSNEGWAVANAGDVNGDGVTDWLVGANRHDTMLDRYLGRVMLHYGNSGGGAGLAPVQFFGAAPFDQLGFSVR